MDRYDIETALLYIGLGLLILFLAGLVVGMLLLVIDFLFWILDIVNGIPNSLDIWELLGGIILFLILFGD